MSVTFRQAAFAAALFACFSAPAAAQTTPNDFTEIVARMSPTVVGITATRSLEAQLPLPDMLPDPFGRRGSPGQPPGSPDEPPGYEGTALGSGFMISEQGHIVTNNHVVEEANEIEVLLQDGTSRPAELVGTDPATDIAVLKIESTEGLAVAGWGNSDALQPGAWTIAIGSPFGLGGTVTVGVLSARSRDIMPGSYNDLLQTDASINRGNSGGPLFNSAGEVIGVNTAIFSPVGTNIGIGFAVPSNTARDVVSQLIETGTVERGYIGVSLQPITEPMARALELDSTEGALVAGVEPDSPAASAGLQEGDVILELNDERIEDPRQLSRLVGRQDPGEEITLSVSRDGEARDVQLALARREPPQATASMRQGGQDSPPDGSGMGLSVTPLPELLRRQLGLGEGQGIMIQGVEPGSPAAEAGLQQGDVIVQAGGEPAASPEDLVAAWQNARQEDRPILLKVTRGETSLFVAVETGQG